MKQDKIWEHFQTQSPEVFSRSSSRLDYLFRKILTLNGENKPRVLNIGVGNGWLEQRCSAQGWETYALDPSEATIAMLGKKGINGKVGYIEAMPYPDSFFDVVFCSEVIEHLSDAQIRQGLQEIERVLKNNGILIGTVPFHENLIDNQVKCPDCGHLFHKWGHQQSFTIDRFKSILSSSFKIKQIKTVYFVHWSSLNWKGIISSLLIKCLSSIGFKSSKQNIFFLLEKSL